MIKLKFFVYQGSLNINSLIFLRVLLSVRSYDKAGKIMETKTEEQGVIREGGQS